MGRKARRVRGGQHKQNWLQWLGIPRKVEGGGGVQKCKQKEAGDRANHTYPSAMRPHTRQTSSNM